MIGMLAGALLLAGCGRKASQLDLPPSAYQPPPGTPGGYRLEPGVTRTPTTRRGETRPVEEPQAYDEDGRPIALKGARKKLPADWLID